MKTKRQARGPKFVGYFWPVIEVLKELGGSARPAEVREQIARKLRLSEATQSELMRSGIPRFDNQVAWARFYLSKAGIIDSSARGVWTLTDRGRSLESLKPDQALKLFRDVHAQFQRDVEDSVEGDDSDAVPPQDSAFAATTNYRQQLIEILRGLPPAGFERFCQRLLRESGFQEVTVTGRSGDGGIDGIGILQVSALVSFKVLFQCKRYAGPVAPSQVRDFRGAMQGRADKGIIVSTGSFSSESKREAVRDGAPPIELVDGEKLVNMIEELQLGLIPIKSFKLDESFFQEFQS